MRSFLFVPADSDKKLGKGLTSGADALIVDLEDSVALERKAAARAPAADFVTTTRQQATRPRLYVRINPLDGPFWRDDVAAIIAARPDGLVLPKPTGGGDVARLAAVLDEAERTAGLVLGTTKIIAIATEVPQSVLAMQTYIGASPRLEVVTWGAEDISAVLGAAATREADGRTWTSPYALVRNLTLFAAVAAGAQPVDTVYVNFRDTEGLRLEAETAARDGFTGKMAIHPDQVAIINAAFTPSAADVAWARDVLALFAANPSAGTLSHKGQMVDKPHMTRAQRILARAGQSAT
jgi:citrate lyase subunit beta/citryl-CoA lyase